MSNITADTKPKSEVNSTDPAFKAQRLQKGRELAREWLSEFEHCLLVGDLDKLGSLFHPESYWRDMLAFQWDFRTHAGRDRIIESWRLALKTQQRPFEVQIEESKVAVFDRKGYGESVEAFFKFETTTGVCRGRLRLLKPLGEERGGTG